LSDSRANMLAALKRVVVPELRARGFRGSTPHFRRERGGCLDLLEIVFSRWGGEFAVELARAPAEGLQQRSGEVIAPAKLRAHHVVARLRLGAGAGSDAWFKFDDVQTPSEFEQVAQRILPLLETQGRITGVTPNVRCS
jgi:hypothetical protein